MKKIVLVDIDGTIAKVGDRVKHLQGKKKDWDAFYAACDEDDPIKEMIALVDNLKNHYEIYFCTGRREDERKKTEKWILGAMIRNADVNSILTDDGVNKMVNEIADEFDSRLLLMRKKDDFRHDTITKPELVDEAGIDLKDVAFVLEDRNSMVTKWRELGLRCLQVAEGDF